jgi:ABC-type sugar transport system ATPase subunit
MARVVVENVVKYYENPETISGEREPALRGVSLEVEDGEAVSVVGPSGCGKSTLLKVVAGLEIPDAGRVLYNELDVTHEKPQDRGVGMVFQDYALYPTHEGKGNLKYYFEVHRRTQAESEARTRETAELMGVDFNYLLGRMPDTLSGGEQQRVAIARCIVRDPLLFLMDEPISNLDAKLRERTRLEIKKLLRRFGITTLYVTHDQQEAIFMGDRIAVMRDGIVEQIGAYDDLYYSPANLFVATFIGAPPMAVFPVQIEDGHVVMEQTRWQLPAWLATQIPAGPAQLGVRPEAWEIDAADGAAVAVRNIERIPTEQAAFIRGQMAGQMLSILAPIDQMEGNEVRISPIWENAYFFVADGEEIIHAPGIQDLF